jgi:hypothetical protein
MGVMKDSEEPVTDEEFVEAVSAFGLYPTFGLLSDGHLFYRIYVISEAPGWRIHQYPWVEPMLWLEFMHEELTDNSEPRFHLVRSKSDERFHRVAYTPAGLAERRLHYKLGWGPIAQRNERRRILAILRRAGVSPRMLGLR